MPTFIDMSALTKRTSLTGNEEFQVSATEKVTAQQIANIVQLSRVIMSGFSALSFQGIEKVKDSNSLLESIAILYDLVAKGNIKLVSNGSTEYGFVSMGDVNGTNHGFGWLLSISEKAIYINNDFTSPNPSTLNNIQWVNTIKAGEKVSLDSGGIQVVTVTNFQTNVWNNDAGTNVFSSVPVGGMVVFKSAADATSGPGEALMGYAIKISSIIASYVGMTTTNGANVTPTLYTHKSSSLYATKWQKLPDDSSAATIVVADAESVATVVAAAFPKFEYGKILPIYIEATSDIYDNLPQIQNLNFSAEESTICGYAQCVYDGGDYYHIGLDLLIYPSSGGKPLYRAEMTISNSGDVVDSNMTPIGYPLAPIPGYTKIANQTDFAIIAGSMAIINFNYEISASASLPLFIDAEIRSSVVGGTVRSVAIPVTFFAPLQGATLMDLCTRTLASGTNIAQVKLNVASVVTGAKGIAGLNCVVTSNNLAQPEDILRIKAVYAKI